MNTTEGENREMSSPFEHTEGPVSQVLDFLEEFVVLGLAHRPVGRNTWKCAFLFGPTFYFVQYSRFLLPAMATFSALAELGK